MYQNLPGKGREGKGILAQEDENNGKFVFNFQGGRLFFTAWNNWAWGGHTMAVEMIVHID